MSLENVIKQASGDIEVDVHTFLIFRIMGRSSSLMCWYLNRREHLTVVMQRMRRTSLITRIVMTSSL